MGAILCDVATIVVFHGLFLPILLSFLGLCLSTVSLHRAQAEETSETPGRVAYGLALATLVLMLFLLSHVL